MKKPFKIKDPGSAVTHFIGMLMAMFAAVPLLIKAAREPDRIHLIALAIFIVSMILLYAASTTYHTLDLSERTNKILKKIVLLSKKGQIEELALIHVLSKEAALKLNEIIKEKTTKNSEILDSSAAIGISAGLGSLAVAGLLKEVQ